MSKPRKSISDKQIALVKELKKAYDTFDTSETKLKKQQLIHAGASVFFLGEVYARFQLHLHGEKIEEALSKGAERLFQNKSPSQ